MYDYRPKHGAAEWAPASKPRASGRHRSRHGAKSRKKTFVIILLFALLAALAIYLFAAPRAIHIDHQNLISDNLPSDIGHLKIVYVSDIHYGHFFSDSRLGDLVNKINDLKPDIILLGGDYAVDNLSAIRFFSVLPSLHARYEIIGIVGDTDRGQESYELTQLTDAMRSAGVIPLVNQVEQVRIGASSIYVAGTDDPVTGKPDLKSIASQTRAEDYVILLSHSPSVISAAHSAKDSNGKLIWFDLGLFGHTHGGQISFMPQACGLIDGIDKRHVSGWYKENRIDMLTSNGIGTSGLPFRIFCPPQIHVIDVSSK